MHGMKALPYLIVMSLVLVAYAVVHVVRRAA
jgi:hypothetical protein